MDVKTWTITAFVGFALALGVLWWIGVRTFTNGCSRHRVSNGSYGTCAQCFQHSDCGEGHMCLQHGASGSSASILQNRCVECLEDSDCRDANARCVHNACMQTCETNQDCSAWTDTCSQDTGLCEPVVSRRGAYTGLDGSIASTHTDGSSCRGAGFAWVHAASVLGWSTTASSQNGYVCVECDPASFAGDGWCDANGHRVACLRDHHCGNGFVCANGEGVCVPQWSGAAGLFSRTGWTFARGFLMSPAMHSACMAWSEREGLFGSNSCQRPGCVFAWRESDLGQVLLFVANRHQEWKAVVPHANAPLRDVDALDWRAPSGDWFWSVHVVQPTVGDHDGAIGDGSPALLQHGSGMVHMYHIADDEEASCTVLMPSGVVVDVLREGDGNANMDKDTLLSRQDLRWEWMNAGA